MFCRFSGTGFRSEDGRGRGAGFVERDVAVDGVGSGCSAGDRGTGWGSVGGVGDGTSRRLRCRDWQSSFVECTTRSDERARTTLCNAVFGVVDRRRTSFTACLSISEVLVSVWVLAVALVVVSRGFVAGVATVAGCDVAVAVGGSKCRTGGWRRGWSAVGWFGSECRRS
jgi:hypothetical protein